jgi:hypothetical protein
VEVECEHELAHRIDPLLEAQNHLQKQSHIDESVVRPSKVPFLVTLSSDKMAP